MVQNYTLENSQRLLEHCHKKTRWTGAEGRDDTLEGRTDNCSQVYRIRVGNRIARNTGGQEVKDLARSHDNWGISCFCVFSTCPPFLESSLADFSSCYHISIVGLADSWWQLCCSNPCQLPCPGSALVSGEVSPVCSASRPSTRATPTIWLCLPFPVRWILCLSGLLGCDFFASSRYRPVF